MSWRSYVLRVVLLVVAGAGPVIAQGAKAGPVPDLVVFTNGDQLTGRLVKVLAGEVTFHSDIVGDVTVPWSKIRTLRSAQQYAVIEKEDRVTKKTAQDKIALGEIAVSGDSIRIKPGGSGEVRVYPTKQTDYLIDAASFQKELRGESDVFYGWRGSITLGASLVEGTDTSQTYTGAVNFVRAIPTVTWLPLGTRTTLNLSGTYGLLTQPQIISGGNVVQTASSAKTNILHGDTEYDKYISPRVFALANASADHNFGSGLQLQHSYGVGFGWSVIKNPKEAFDVKANVHYEQQRFYNGVTSALGTPDENLIGSDLSETWSRMLAHSVKFSENVTLSPTFNVVQAYSGFANANLLVPIYRKFSLTLASTDNYLGDPPAGYRRNTFQFTAGVTYVLK